jgi:branched-chain amino acid transport system permease protein
MRRAADPVIRLLAPIALVGIAALVGTIVSTSAETYVINALVNVVIVVALYVFIGNSGVLSFGHISFVAVGAWVAGVLSMPVEEKPAIMPNVASLFRDHTDRQHLVASRSRPPSVLPLRSSPVSR